MVGSPPRSDFCASHSGTFHMGPHRQALQLSGAEGEGDEHGCGWERPWNGSCTDLSRLRTCLLLGGGCPALPSHPEAVLLVGC